MEVTWQDIAIAITVIATVVNLIIAILEIRAHIIYG